MLRTGLFRTPSILAALRAEAAERFLRWREVERAVERVNRGIHASTSAMKTPMPPHTQSDASVADLNGRWNKEAWEAQWEGELSQEVALHLRRRRAGTVRRITPLPSLPARTRDERQTSYFHAQSDANAALDTPMPLTTDERTLVSCPSISAAFDPLHLPSLVVFSFSVLGALRTRIFRSVGISGGREDARRRASASNAEDDRRQGGKRGFGYTVGIGIALVSAFCAGFGIGLFAARF